MGNMEDEGTNKRSSLSDRAGHSAMFDLLEHPADVKLRAWGATLEQLFSNAAQGNDELYVRRRY
jgi:hypothetical protein